MAETWDERLNRLKWLVDPDSKWSDERAEDAACIRVQAERGKVMSKHEETITGEFRLAMDGYEVVEGFRLAVSRTAFGRIATARVVGSPNQQGISTRFHDTWAEVVCQLYRMGFIRIRVPVWAPFAV